MSNVLTWKNALDSGNEPRCYPYAAGNVPIGQYPARLDFKIWAKNAMAINCYFTSTAGGEKFRLTVFRRRDNEQYELEASAIDFKQCPVAVNYLITVTKNKMGNPVFKSASLDSPE